MEPADGSSSPSMRQLNEMVNFSAANRHQLEIPDHFTFTPYPTTSPPPTPFERARELNQSGSPLAAQAMVVQAARASLIAQQKQLQRQSGRLNNNAQLLGGPSSSTANMPMGAANDAANNFTAPEAAAESQNPQSGYVVMPDGTYARKKARVRFPKIHREVLVPQEYTDELMKHEYNNVDNVILPPTLPMPKMVCRFTEFGCGYSTPMKPHESDSEFRKRAASNCWNHEERHCPFNQNKFEPAEVRRVKYDYARYEAQKKLRARERKLEVQKELADRPVDLDSEPESGGTGKRKSKSHSSKSKPNSLMTLARLAEEEAKVMAEDGSSPALTPPQVPSSSVSISGSSPAHNFFPDTPPVESKRQRPGKQTKHPVGRNYVVAQGDVRKLASKGGQQRFFVGAPSASSSTSQQQQHLDHAQQQILPPDNCYYPPTMNTVSYPGLEMPPESLALIMAENQRRLTFIQQTQRWISEFKTRMHMLHRLLVQTRVPNEQLDAQVPVKFNLLIDDLRWMDASVFHLNQFLQQMGGCAAK